MKKHLNRGRNCAILAAVFFGVSFSVAAAPHNMASWGGDKKEDNASHAKSGHGGGDWSKKKGTNHKRMFRKPRTHITRNLDQLQGSNDG